MLDGLVPGPALGGGVLIGLAASLLLAFNGRVAGISGIVGALFTPAKGEIGWRVAFLGGLLGGGLLAYQLWPQSFGTSPVSLGWVIVAGFLVGFGTRLGNGCTSGHGVCGVARFSPRSLAATLTFIATGALGVWLGRWLGAV